MRGQGKPGFCSICASPNAPEYIKGARLGWNSAQFDEVARKNGEHWNRQTYYEHKKHAQTGEQRVIQAAVAVREKGELTVRDIKRSSNTELLEAIRDLGMARALSNPEDISIDHALKATQILESRKDKSQDHLAILVAFVTGNAPQVQIDRPQTTVIEGTAQEIPA